MGLNIGIIGAGSVARQHAFGFIGHGSVSSVCVADTSDRALQSMREECGISRTETDYRALLSDTNIDTVDICLPHWLHHRVCLQAFTAGKNVIIEKPIAMTLAEADEMIAAGERAGKRFYVSMNDLFLPAHKLARKMIDAGEIGDLMMAVFKVLGNELERLNDPLSWKGTWDKAGGGALIDTGMHLIYLTEHYFGRPERVTAITRQLAMTLKDKAEDTTTFVMEYPSAIVTHVLTYASTGTEWEESWEIVGTNGSIKGWHDMTSPLVVTRAGKTTLTPLPRLGDNWWNESLRLSVQHAVDCIISARPFDFTPEQAKSALAVALAAYESAKSDAVVRLPVLEAGR